MNNYEADRAMNQKRLRMEGEGGHSVVQGNGLPLNYIDNGHQLGYPAYGGAYNAHYPPPEAFSAYGPPPPGGYGPPQYAPPAHQNYHQPFASQQQGQPPQLHMPPQSHMSPSGPQATYAGAHDHHKTSWPMAPLDAGKLPDVKHAPVKQEVKMEPADMHRPVVSEAAPNLAEMEQPKIKIKTDLFKPDQESAAALRPEVDKAPHLKEKGHITATEPMVIASAIPLRTDVPRIVLEEPPAKPADPAVRVDDKAAPTTTEPPADLRSAEALVEAAAEGAARVSDSGNSTDNSATKNEKFAGFSDASSSSEDESKIPNEIYFGTPDVSTYRPKASQSPAATKSVTPSSALEPKKRGRPKGSTNKPKPPPPPAPALAGARPSVPRAAAPSPRAAPIGRPRAPAAYQYAVRPFRRDFSGIQFRRRWSDDCLDSSHIPNEVFFGDVPVPTEVLFNYYDAGAERERAAQAQLAAQKVQQAKMAALASARVVTSEITTVDSSSSDDSSDGSSSDSDDSDPDDSRPLKRGPGRPRGSKTSPRVSTDTPARRGRPPVPPELREPGITDMKRFCKAAGIRFDYKKLVEGCTKNKERVAKMMDLLVAKGLQGKPTLEKCQALKEDTNKKKAEAKQKKEKERKSKVAESQKGVSRRVTRGQTSSKPRQKIVISSEEDDDTLDTRRTLSKLRSMVNDTDSD